MQRPVQFSSLVRKGLRFRRKFEEAKKAITPRDFDWYPYDSFANLFFVQHLLDRAGLSLETVIGAERVLDLGAADGALSFFLESLGFKVQAWDYSGTSMNGMRGIRTLAAALGSSIEIQDVNLDQRFALSGKYRTALFLGTLYHLKNPFYALETLARQAQYCFLGTRVARRSADGAVVFQDLPVAFLVDAGECNADSTNYWIFSPAGLARLVERAGWKICSSATNGVADSDPVNADRDERMFLLLESQRREV